MAVDYAVATRYDYARGVEVFEECVDGGAGAVVVASQGFEWGVGGGKYGGGKEFGILDCRGVAGE